MPRSAAGGLNQTRSAAQIAFLVGVQNADQRDFRQVETLAKKIDADQNVAIPRADGAACFNPAAFPPSPNLFSALGIQVVLPTTLLLISNPPGVALT